MTLCPHYGSNWKSRRSCSSLFFWVNAKQFQQIDLFLMWVVWLSAYVVVNRQYEQVFMMVTKIHAIFIFHSDCFLFVDCHQYLPSYLTMDIITYSSKIAWHFSLELIFFFEQSCVRFNMFLCISFLEKSMRIVSDRFSVLANFEFQEMAFEHIECLKLTRSIT